jgi:hypothetical protein
MLQSSHVVMFFPGSTIGSVLNGFNWFPSWFPIVKERNTRNIIYFSTDFNRLLLTLLLFTLFKNMSKLKQSLVQWKHQQFPNTAEIVFLQRMVGIIDNTLKGVFWEAVLFIEELLQKCITVLCSLFTTVVRTALYMGMSQCNNDWPGLSIHFELHK